MLYKEELSDYKFIIEELMTDHDLSRNIFQYCTLEFSNDDVHKIVFDHPITEKSFSEFREILLCVSINGEEEWDTYCNSSLFLNEVTVYCEVKIDHLTYNYLTGKIIDTEIKDYLFKFSEKPINISLAVIEFKKHYAKKFLRYVAHKDMSLEESCKIRDIFYEYCL